MRNVTLCLAYYENPSMLQIQYEYLQRLSPALSPRVGLIVVDDGSPKYPAIPPVALDLGFGVQLYRMLQDIPWNQDACRNLAVSKARSDWVLLTDMDHVPSVGLWRWALENERLDANSVYTFKRVNAPDLTPYKPHPNSWLMTRQLYAKSGGYDERFRGVYGTDGIFRSRLQVAARHMIECNEALIRYSRNVVPDASTTTLTRKSKANEELRDEVKLQIKRSKHQTPMRGLTPWERVA